MASDAAGMLSVLALLGLNGKKSPFQKNIMTICKSNTALISFRMLSINLSQYFSFQNVKESIVDPFLDE